MLALHLLPKKATGRKKSSSLDSGADVAPVTLGDTTAVKAKILIKKGRGNLEKKQLGPRPSCPVPGEGENPLPFRSFI